MILKKLFALGLAATSIMFVTPSASALILIGLGTKDGGHIFDDIRYQARSRFVCLVILPVCLFDEKMPTDERVASSQVSYDVLKDNGYDDETIKLIQIDQIKVSEALIAQNLHLSLSKNDTIESVKTGLQELVPDVSDAYVQFFWEYASK